jgi:hypothetical protein
MFSDTRLGGRKDQLEHVHGTEPATLYLSYPRANSTQTVRTILVKSIYDICERLDVCEQTNLIARMVS